MDPVRHFELTSNDRDALGKFYSDLFGWHAESFPEMSYVSIDTHSGTGMNGGIGPHGEGEEGPRSSVYAQVEDLDATLAKVTANGGTVILPPQTIPNVVSLAIFADPAGNATGLVRDESGEDNGVSAGDNPAVTWFEILGPDAKALRDFYAAVFGWEYKESGADSGFEYYEVQGDDRVGGGIGGSPDGKPRVTSYAEVDDLQARLDKAASLGATVLMPPTEMGAVSFAQFADPAGNSFGLFKRN